LLTGNPNLEVFGQEAERCSSSSRLWVSSHALEGQKWFDQIFRVPEESVEMYYTL
jgi:hypothetical protein